MVNPKYSILVTGPSVLSKNLDNYLDDFFLVEMLYIE
jgi:hypothetical protein